MAGPAVTGLPCSRVGNQHTRERLYRGVRAKRGSKVSGTVDLSSMPLVLAGPILRRVEPTSVSVWVALREERTATLTVSDGTNSVLNGNPQTTVQVGENLHLGVITAGNVVDGPLGHGTVYEYEMDFENGQTLSDANVLEGGLDSIIYAGQNNPTFSLPPPDPNDLRLVHSSCRKPHGEGFDALPAVGKMIESTVDDALDRPHQLFLTGDQIYADDVADSLLAHLIPLGSALLGETEQFETAGGQRTIEQLHPGRRAEVAERDCGFSSGASKSHLFGLAEYYAMYLSCFSETTWPATLPTPEEVLAEEYGTAMRFIRELGDPSAFTEPEDWTANVGHIGHLKRQLREEGRYGDMASFSKAASELEAFVEARRRVEQFEADLPIVRRALANVPTYMIFDDHEVTDDWFLNGDWTERVLGKSMGQQVIQNGLIAYAVCQAWGNTPELFEVGTRGHTLLDTVTVDGSSSDLDIDRDGLDAVLDIPSVNQGLTWPENPIEWHYSLSGTADGNGELGHEVLVLNTRTRRGFDADDGLAPPQIVSAAALQTQLPDATAAAKVSIVISAVPVWNPPVVDFLQDVAYVWDDEEEADYEHWRLQHDAREQLIARLAARIPSVGDPPARARTVFLSGDVHYGFGARVQYWAERPFEAAGPDETELIVATFTASAAKNQDLKTSLLNALGYQAAWILPFPLWLPILGVVGVKALFQGKEMPLPPGDEAMIGIYPLVKLIEGMPEEILFGWNERPETLRRVPFVTEEDPAMVSYVQDLGTWELAPAPEPDWRYRVDYVDAETYYDENETPDASATDIAIPKHGGTDPQTREKAMATYYEQVDWWRQWVYNEDPGPSDRSGEYGHGAEVAGMNNIGEIAFEWGPTDKRAIQALWWRLANDEESEQPFPFPFPLSKYVVSLEYDDSDHPRPKAVVES